MLGNTGYSTMGKEPWECMVQINSEGLKKILSKSWRGWLCSEVCMEWNKAQMRERAQNKDFGAGKDQRMENYYMIGKQFSL